MDQSYFVRAICGDIVGTCSAPRNLKPKATRQISNWAQLRGGDHNSKCAQIMCRASFVR